METIRQTEDVDFALAVGDWSAFARLKQRLIDTGRFFEVPGAQQRLRHASDLPVDLVPFGGVEAADRQVAWPPGGEFRMSVFGFREALASCLRVRLPEGVETSVVSLPALALLKIIAWQDRHYRAPRKDALDLALIASNYLDLGNMDRLWNEFPAWKSPMPEQYSWPSLVKKDGNELFDHYRHTLEALGNQKGLLGLIFSKAQNKFHDPAKLRRLVVDLIDKEETFKGWELVQATARLCAMNMLPHGIGSQDFEPVVVADSLAADPGERFDLMLTNPPFGKKSSTTIVGEEGKVSLADGDNLPPPDVIAQEIVEDLEAALAQFKLIAADLGAEVTEEA